MFVDASVLTAIMLDEPDAVVLARTIALASHPVTAPPSVWETVVAVSRETTEAPLVAHEATQGVLAKLGVRIVAVPPETVRLAIEAFERFGKGRHPASLNFGDCFSYASARHLGVPLLFKGEDFARTDVEAAARAD